MMNPSDPANDPQSATKNRLIEELRDAVRARDEFVSIAAHELRNPMTPILMQVGSLLAAAKKLDGCRPEVLLPRLEALDLAVKEFVRRATTLLDVSRIAGGNLQIELTKVDVSRVVSDVLARSAAAARMARCPLEADLEEGIIGMLDRLAVEQVVENLLVNALKFGAGRPVRIVLRSDGSTVRLAIQDHGIGISEDDQARIFQRFERAVTQREHGGFGIGLWLGNQLVTAMGGLITVESARGEGSTFTVMLPIGAMS